MDTTKIIPRGFVVIVQLDAQHARVLRFALHAIPLIILIPRPARVG